MRKSAAAFLPALGLCLLASLALALMLGPVRLTFGEALGALLAGDWSRDDPGTLAQRIVWSLRLPRTLLAALAGGGLAAVGAVLQTLTRNPLADPWVLGISSGAGLGAVIVIAAGLTLGGATVPLGAFLGALLAFALVLLLAGRALSAASSRFVLTGVAVTQLFAALTSLITLWKTDADTARGVMFWLLGSFAGADGGQVLLCALALAAALAGFFALAGVLDVLAFGATTARSLGVEVGRIALLLYCLATLLTAIIVACCGAIGFIGLTVPHVARLLVGGRHRHLLAASVLCGAAVTVLADTLARTLFAPAELPVGILTALLGVPVFLLLISRAPR